AGDDIWWVYVVARLREGIGLGQAQAAVDAVFRNDVLDKTKELFKTADAPRLVLMPAPQAISRLRERFSTPLAILMTVVGMVLLVRSEEHTSELQSRFDLVCRLLLEKKK